LETAYSYTKRILNRYSIRAKKSLGQNFLISDGVIENIITQSGLQVGDYVLEVGPGPGVLTQALSEIAGKVWAIELDDNFSKILVEEFKAKDNVKIIHTDALSFNLQDLKLPEGSKLKLIANLPYYITSPLINHFIDQRQYLQSMTIMVQQEVARRIAAKPGTKDYGILSVATQAYCDASVLFVVPPSSFLPAPKVHSAVIHLQVLPAPRINPDTEQKFFKIVKAAFSQRRKTLLNSMSHGLGIEKDALSNIIKRMGLSANIRAEELSIEDYNKLTEELYPLTLNEKVLI
jgi:16S rRNA (adenine1518-N6/adenine1519-N6)-dimethyltransferase